MWICENVHRIFSSRVVSGLSYKPVKTDLDGAPWLSLNDPLTAQGVLVVARPPRGQNDTRWPWVVAPTRSWKVEKSGRRSTVKIKAAAKSKAELLFFFLLNLQSQSVNITFYMAVFHFIFPLSFLLLDILHNIHIIMSDAGSVPSHLGIRPLHITLPSSRWHVMVSAPWVLIKPSSHATEMELPSWKLSPKRLAFSGMPGSGHSLRPNACNKKKQNTIWSIPVLCEWGIGSLRSKEISEIDVAIWRKRGKTNLSEVYSVYLRVTTGCVFTACSDFATTKTMLINEAPVSGAEMLFDYFFSFP